jgi:hypothetical protein
LFTEPLLNNGPTNYIIIRPGWEDNIKIYLGEIGSEDVN